MNSSYKTFTLISQILFTGLSNYCRKAIGKQPPQKASPFLIEIAWRMTHCELDFLIEKKINAGCSNSSYTNDLLR
jgi:hypothetical protein